MNPMKRGVNVGRARSLAVCLTYYTALTQFSITAHDWLANSLWGLSSAPAVGAAHEVVSPDTGGYDLHFPRLLALYAGWLIVWRVWHLRNAYVVYEYCWLCNFTIIVSSLAMATGRPWLALAYCSVVGIDQFLWYVDLIYYLAVSTLSYIRRKGTSPKRRFLVGVCQYVFDDQTSWKTRITCTHHLWTIPAVIWQLVHEEELAIVLRRGMSQQSIVTAWLFLSLLSLLYMTVHVVLSRLLIPLYDVETGKYLNVNLGHALWKDVKIPWLQINHPSAATYLPRLLLRWQVLNMIFSFVFVGFAQHATTQRR
jgi:hypothetical protein